MARATETKSARKRAPRPAPSDKRTIDQLAALLDLPNWESVDEINADYYAECAASSCDLGTADHDDEGACDAQIKAEQAAQDEVFAKWYDAVQSAADTLLAHHGLEWHHPAAAPKGAPAFSRVYEGRVVPAGPAGTWDAAADAIRETINGVGDFHFNTLREFLDSGPYTARRAVLAHLAYVADYPAVYGTSSARRIYEGGWS